MSISPQAQSIYQTLLNANGALSAKELGVKLHIFPTTVYRLIGELDRIGLIVKTDQYPFQFRAKSVDEGLSLFLLNQTDWFTNQFSTRPRLVENEGIQFSFIQSRDELMKTSVEEIGKAKKSVDLLRSGHEIPADVMLATIEAKRRGVITRMLIQDFNNENAQQVAFWKKNGILVRKFPLIRIRLMIYDAKTVYIMSYKHKNSKKDLGMKISYPPLAAIFSKLFEDWWEKAERV